MSNFLGKKISLISKALIRYEGVLYTIDQSAFTVALSKVKSFGTEDRPAERYIAAREEIYEYIIFRGSDISDLHVCEHSVCADDSAIVQIMSPNITSPPSPLAPTSQLRGNNKDINASDSISHFQEPVSPVSKPPISISKRFTNLTKASNRTDENNSTTKRTYFSKSQIEVDTPFIKRIDSEDLEEIAAQDYRQFKNREQVNKFDTNYEHNDENRQYSYHRPPTSRRGFRSNNTNTHGYMTSANRGRNKDELPICSIKDDFDFESSNALIAEELANLEISYPNILGNISHGGCQEDNLNDEGGDDCEKIFYDKSKSFFDNISSEVSDRGGNTAGERSRRNNVETFGTTEYNRGGNRGYRGSRWNGGMGAFRDCYSGGSTGFIKRGGNSRRGEGRGGRNRFSQRRPFSVNGGLSGF